MEVMEKIAPIGKAITGAVIALLTAIATALADNGISGQEWVTAGIAFFVAFAAVWTVPWKPKIEEPVSPAARTSSKQARS